MPKPITIDVKRSFGRPCIRDTGICTDVVADRFIAGESIEALAKDYERSAGEIQDALRFELATPALKLKMVEIADPGPLSYCGYLMSLDFRTFQWRIARRAD